MLYSPFTSIAFFMKTQHLLDVPPSQMDDVCNFKAFVREDSFSWEKLPASRSRHNTIPTLESMLGPGPMRFAPVRKERKVDKQIQALRVGERESLDALRKMWTQKAAKKEHLRDLQLTDAHILRYARACSFHRRKTWKVLKHFGKPAVQRLLSLKAAPMEEQLRSQTLFPLPGLQTRQGFDVFYMKPSRYNPKETSTQLVIDNLGYVMNSMLEREHNSSSGIAFLANMNDWTFEHFSTEYCRKFMEMLQGHYFPVRVNLFLIVNPPQWFGKVWKLMKPMLSVKFRKKVHIIPESALFEFLPFHYESYLPDDLETGSVSTKMLVEDFVAYRLFVENRRQKGSSQSLSKRRKDQQICNHSVSTTHNLSDMSFCVEGAPQGCTTDHQMTKHPRRLIHINKNLKA